MFVKILVSGAMTATLSMASGSENNSSSQNDLTQKALKKAMEKEKKYAKEQKFYHADEYDFKGAEVDPAILNNIETIEPDYDHSDDWGACDNN